MTDNILKSIHAHNNKSACACEDHYCIWGSSTLWNHRKAAAMFEFIEAESMLKVFVCHRYPKTVENSYRSIKIYRSGTSSYPFQLLSCYHFMGIVLILSNGLSLSEK